LEARNAEFDVRDRDLVNAEAQLAAQRVDLDEARDGIATLQTQLERERQEIAAQRSELSQRLGVPVPEPPPPVDVIVREAPDPPAPLQEEPPVAEPEPKQPASGLVDRFRKLRRDAKRRAIGGM
jgi:outer membrane protein TolC